ncbi:MAG TPA: hypothetical protein PKX15_02125 [Bacteroidales bacterium]|nr:hypothetical protein [Bacteroidales bacterium]
MKTLNFSIGNAKIKKDNAIFSLPAGFSCPFAKICLSKANRETGKITDGPDTQFRCYAASIEALFSNVRKSRWDNFEELKASKTTLQMAAKIEASIPIRDGKTKFVRVHQSGDFFNQTYFDAWLLVAKSNPHIIFYGYTKALPFWIKRLNEMPSNFRLVASLGGTHDHLIKTFNLRSARVVNSEWAAKRKFKLPIDHDDSHVWNYDGDFAILIHGTQPAGTQLSKTMYRNRKNGKGGYKAAYFSHYIRKGKTSSKIVNGKKIHVAPAKARIKRFNSKGKSIYAK